MTAAALPFRLGYLTHLDGREPAAELYEYTLELARIAEGLGLDSFWVSERHFHRGNAGLSDALTWIAAASRVTSRVGLGTAVVPVPLRGALDLAERAAIVDALSHGRLELGIGSGIGGAASIAFGHDDPDVRAATDRAEQELHRLLSGEPVVAGEQDRLFPARPGLRRQIWRGTQQVPSAILAARHGDGLLLPRSQYGAPKPIGPWQRDVALIYREELAARPSETNPSAEPPSEVRIAASRTLYPAASRDAALADLRARRTRFAPPDTAETAEDVVKELAEGHVAYGTAEELIDWLRQDVSIPFVTDLVLGFQPAITTFEQEVAKLTVLATEVAPALGWHPNRGTDTRRPVTLAQPGPDELRSARVTRDAHGEPDRTTTGVEAAPGVAAAVR